MVVSVAYLAEWPRGALPPISYKNEYYKFLKDHEFCHQPVNKQGRGNYTLKGGENYTLSRINRFFQSIPK